MQKWEYYIYGAFPIYPYEPDNIDSDFLDELREFDQKIDQFGNEGWELVGIGNVHTNHHLLYFKRPREESNV